ITPMRMRVRALSLPGCGCRGAFQMAVVSRLAAAGERFDLVAGASSGSVTGCVTVAGLATRGPDMWRELAAPPILSRRYLPSEGSPFGMSRILRDALERFVPEPLITDSATEFLVSTTRVRRFAVEAFRHGTSYLRELSRGTRARPGAEARVVP